MHFLLFFGGGCKLFDSFFICAGFLYFYIFYREKRKITQSFVWHGGCNLLLLTECKLVQPLWKIVWRFLKKLKIEFPYDPAIPLLGIYPDKTRIQKDTCTPMFITAALFTIAKTWKQPKCPLTEEWVKKMWYIHTMEYYSAIKRMKSCHLQQHGWT